MAQEPDFLNSIVETSKEAQKVNSTLKSTTNLSSKIDCLLRDIKNLTEKKIRLEFEIKRKKQALVRKRSELKKVSKSLSSKARISLESQNSLYSSFTEEFKVKKQTIDKLLSESARILEE